MAHTPGVKQVRSIVMVYNGLAAENARLTGELAAIRQVARAFVRSAKPSGTNIMGETIDPRYDALRKRLYALLRPQPVKRTPDAERQRFQAQHRDDVFSARIAAAQAEHALDKPVKAGG